MIWKIVPNCFTYVPNFFSRPPEDNAWFRRGASGARATTTASSGNPGSAVAKSHVDRIPPAPTRRCSSAPPCSRRSTAASVKAASNIAGTSARGATACWTTAPFAAKANASGFCAAYESSTTEICRWNIANAWAKPRFRPRRRSRTSAKCPVPAIANSPVRNLRR